MTLNTFTLAINVGVDFTCYSKKLSDYKICYNCRELLKQRQVF